MKPILQALLVADHVYTDQITGKKIIAGIFHSVRFKPDARPQSRGESNTQETILRVDAGGQKAGSPFCYISLTELRGEQNFELRYVDLAENNALFRAQFALKSDDPIGTQEVIIPLPELPVIRAGAFALELLCGEEPLGSHRIVFIETAEEKPKNDD